MINLQKIEIQIIITLFFDRWQGTRLLAKQRTIPVKNFV